MMHRRRDHIPRRDGVTMSKGKSSSNTQAHGQRSNVHNPNNPAHQAAQVNRGNQMNPQHAAHPANVGNTAGNVPTGGQK